MSILAKIIEQKKLEIAGLDAQVLRHAAESSPAPRDFLAAIAPRPFVLTSYPLGSGATAKTKRRDEQRGRVSLIAELKRASPSKGILAPHLDLFQVAEIYSQNGAAAISV